MAREIKPPKPRLKHLMVLKRMVEEDLGLCSSSTLQSSILSFYKADMSKHLQESYDWFRINIGSYSHLMQGFYDWGWLTDKTKPPEEKDGFGRAGIFSWSDRPYGLTKRARTYWEETGKHLYEELLVKKAEEQAKVERLIAVRVSDSHLRSGYHSGISSRAGILLRVLRETPTRLYVEVVKSNPYTRDMGYHFLGGSTGKYFVERNQVTFEGITEAQYLHICEVESHIISRAKALQDEEARAIQELKKNFADRRLQQEAEFDDIMQGILD